MSRTPRDLPTGTVTFLFTDIEGSTQLLHAHGDDYPRLLADHHRLLRSVWVSHRGVEVDTVGDAFFVAFGDAGDAVAAAGEAQAALAATGLRVRMGIHTGTPQLGETGYTGIDVHKAARIAAVAHGEQVLLSEATRKLVDAPFRDLGRHRLKDLTAPERLFQLGEIEFPPLRTLFVTNLPVQPNPFVGRACELEEIGALIRTGSRLVTLTGAGGSGKTRLAMHVAAELVELFADGAWFVSLASVTDHTLLEPTIAQSLGVRGELREDLRSKRLLLVLDNLEQILDGASAVAELLAEAPGVQVVATSRERLAVAAEQEYPVPTLPAADGASLFAERARRLVPSFEPSDDVLEIVRRLDGLPLAIELAAARVKVLTVEQILERLGRSLDLLTSSGHDVPERQRTLRATMEWSHDLLSDSERELFAKLGVFPGGFDLVAAEQIAGGSLDGLAALIDKSLVRATGDGRYFMLETIRSFAVERLEDTRHGPELRDEHAKYFVSVVAVLEPGLRDARQDDVIDRLVAEQPNIRSALDWLHEAGDPRTEAALASDCSYLWFLTGTLREGLARLQAAYGRLHEHDEAERGRAANGLSLLSFITGDVNAARVYAEEALIACRRTGDVPGTLRALVGNVATAQSSEEARRLSQEQVDLAGSAGERWYLALGLCNAGVAERDLGNLERSRELALQGLEVAQELGDVQLAVGCACNAAHADLLLNDLSAAEVRFREALALLAKRPLPEMAIWCLDGLAAIAARNGDAEWGARLFGGAEALIASTSYNHPDTKLELNRTRSALEEALGAERTAALRTEGAGLELAAIIDLALS